MATARGEPHAKSDASFVANTHRLHENDMVRFVVIARCVYGHGAGGRKKSADASLQCWGTASARFAKLLNPIERSPMPTKATAPAIPAFFIIESSLAPTFKA